MPALDDCEPTPSFTATTTLLLNQLSRPVKATVCEIDVNKLILTETLQTAATTGELRKQRPKASHKVNNDKGSDSDKSTSRGGVGTAASGAIDGRTKMANMRLFVSTTATRRGATRFITVTSSLVTDEEVDAATEGKAGRTVKASMFTVCTTACSAVCAGTDPCFLSCLTESGNFCINMHTCDRRRLPRAKSLFLLSSLSWYVINCDDITYLSMLQGLRPCAQPRWQPPLSAQQRSQQSVFTDGWRKKDLAG